MESWRAVWRRGVSKVLSLEGLKALRRGLQNDDHRLTQGSTTTPPTIQAVLDWECEGACPIAFAFWQGDKGGNATVGECEEAFAARCFEADNLLGEPAAVRYLLNWIDDIPREDMRRLLLEEVDRSLADRMLTPEVAA